MESRDRHVGLAGRIGFYAIAIVILFLATMEMLNHLGLFGDFGIVSPHVMHSAGHLVVSLTLVTGIGSQLWRAGRHQAGPQQVVVMAGTVAVGLIFSMYFSPFPIILFVAAPLLVVAVLAALHPRRHALVRLGERNFSRRLAVLAVVALVPLTWYAFTQAATQRAVGADSIHTGHYSLMAVAAVLVGMLALLASLRTPGWRLPAYMAGFSGVLLGVTSLAFPHEPSVFPAAFAILIVAWAVAVPAYAEWQERGAGDPATHVGPIVVGAVVLLLSVAACGGQAAGVSQSGVTASGTPSALVTSAPPVASGTSDPCALLTEQQVAAALGNDPGAGVQSQPGVCKFGNPPQAGSLSISLPSSDGPDFGARRARGQQMASQTGGQFVDFDGIGDHAFATSQKSSAAMLIIKGGHYVQILVFGSASLADPVTAVKGLGRVAAGRL